MDTKYVIHIETYFQWGVPHEMFKDKDYSELLMDDSEAKKSAIIYQNISKSRIH